MIRERLGWEPSTSLRAGLAHTYRWIFDQVLAHALVASSKRRPRSPAIGAANGKVPARPARHNVAA
jgi:dTDP-D-glucose 4,6-dehydratase